MTTTSAALTSNTDAGPMRQAVFYLRVSTGRQMETAIDIDPDGNSIATQRELCQRKAANVNAVMVREFIEPGNSAQTIEKRPVFRELLHYLAENPGIDYVIIYMRSRAFRNLADAVITKRQLEKFGIRLLSAKEDFGEGYLADAMEAVTDIFNEIEVRRNGEDIKVKLQHKALNGGTISRAKVGYLNIRADFDGRLVNTIGLDPDRADLVRQTWQLYATGDYALEALSEVMADRGLTTRPSPKRPAKPLDVETIRKMLHDPYYTGVMVYKGEIVPTGRHPAIISQELFDQVQRILDARSRRGQRDRVLQHYLKGILYCDRCFQRDERESRLIYTEARNRTGTYYGYFLCRGRQAGLCDLPHLPAHQVEEAVYQNYYRLQLPENFTRDINQQLEATMADQQHLTQELHQILTKQLTELDKREDRLLDLAADGTLSKSKIQQRINKLRLERVRIEAGLSDTSAELALGAQRLRACLDLLASAAELYRDTPDSGRRQLNQTFYQRLYLDELPEVSVIRDVLNPPFDEIDDTSWVYQQQTALSINKRKQNSPGLPARAVRTTNTPVLADVFPVSGSSKTVLVELRRFELLTPSMRTRCATSCATAPSCTRWPSTGPTYRLSGPRGSSDSDAARAVSSPGAAGQRERSSSPRCTDRSGPPCPGCGG